MAKEYNGQLQLASKGFFYNDQIPDGIINVEPWGTPEERLLISPSISFTETVTRLIKKLTDSPIDPGELLLVDRWHLFIYMRCLSVGADYSFNFKCDECNTKNRHSIDLEKDLDVTYADDTELLETLGAESVEEPFALTFPVNGKTIKWRMLRGKDEAATEKYVARMRANPRNKKLPQGEDPGYVHRLACRILDIDGTEPTISDSMALIESLKGKDTLALRQAIADVSLGVNQELRPICDSCGWENEITMPLDKTFFRPERRAV
jgi:hypothetical protein